MAHKRYLPIRWLGMAAWGLFVLLLTILPGNTPFVSAVTQFIGDTPESGMVGHLGLFAILTLLSWRALNNWFVSHHALLMAMAAALLLGTMTEFFQWFVSGRSSTLYDLFANWLGVFAVGFAASYLLLIAQLRKSTSMYNKRI